MHSVLLTILLFTGADPMAPTADQQPYVAPVTSQCDQCADNTCAEGNSGGCVQRLGNFIFDWWGPMPQTCYAPRYGCYPGNNRFMHRSPAFHGSYYREPYNYRNYFDYPWHAQPHEPMGYFTYQRDVTVDQNLQPIPADPTAPAGIQPQTVPTPPSPPLIKQSGWKPVASLRTLRK